MVETRELAKRMYQSLSHSMPMKTSIEGWCLGDPERTKHHLEHQKPKTQRRRDITPNPSLGQSATTVNFSAPQQQMVKAQHVDPDSKVTIASQIVEVIAAVPPTSGYGSTQHDQRSGDHKRITLWHGNTHGALTYCIRSPFGWHSRCESTQRASNATA